MQLKTIKEADLTGKKVLIRTDFNVPIDDFGKITDDKRIKAALPTIQFCLDAKASQIILMSHLGKPKGKIIDKLRMNPVAEQLQKLLNQAVKKLDDCIDIVIPEADGEKNRIVLLENLRFNPKEQENDKDFAMKLAEIADVYINDAFGTCHRAHASVHAITNFIDSYAGLLVEKEVSVIENILKNAEHPFIAVMGGVKVSDKIEVIENLLTICDNILVGGAMMFTFLKANNAETGKSIVENESIGTAKKLIELSQEKIVLPVDTIVDSGENVFVTDIGKEQMGLDIGNKTAENFSEIILKAKTIFWNGPLGKYEDEQFKNGTDLIAQAIAKATEQGAVSVVGGGDVVAAVNELGFEEKFSYVSTGGGASLDLLAGKKLPGIEVLKKQEY